MFKFITNLYEYFFSPWDTSIMEEGKESWFCQPYGTFSKEFRIEYHRCYIKYKYKHKFRNKEKIIKRYLS